MSHETCETVRVKAQNDAGFAVINKADMSDEYTLFEEPKLTEAEKAEVAAAEVAAAAATGVPAWAPKA